MGSSGSTAPASAVGMELWTRDSLFFTPFDIPLWKHYRFVGQKLPIYDMQNTKYYKDLSYKTTTIFLINVDFFAQILVEGREGGLSDRGING